MFTIDENKNITMHAGDTGAFIVRPTELDTAGVDVVLFTIRNSEKIIKLQRIYPFENGMITIRFENEDTDTWEPGNYSWETRYVVDPVYDEEEKLIGGQEVYTPESKSGTHRLKIVEPLGTI